MIPVPDKHLYLRYKQRLYQQYELKAKTVSFDSTSSSVGTDRIVALALAIYPFKVSRLKYAAPQLAQHGYIRAMQREPRASLEDIYATNIIPYRTRYYATASLMGAA